MYFQKEDIDLRQVFFAIPITLTKKEEWIVSQKTFFILPTGERKQISHLTYSEINDFHNFSKNMNQDYKVLKLNKILSFLPNRSNFLFYLVGSNREKMIKNLEKTQSKITGDLYLSSSNEKILKDLMFLQASLNSTLKPEVKILHSFKALIRLELLSFFPHAFKKVLGQGLIVPNSFSPSYEILNLLKQENKLLFFEKNPPYTSQDQHLIKNSQALISSHVKLAISSIKDEKSCLIKN